jgi:molybdopterin molybdotransferase
MLTYEEALAKVLAEAAPLPIKKVVLEDLLGHVLAEPVKARFDLPSFDNSAVDGYGVLTQDLAPAGPQNPVRLGLLGEVKAGSAESFVLSPGATIKILTGALVPPNVEAVVMREYCEEKESNVFVTTSVQRGENIRLKGAEVKAGATVLQRGKRIGPAELGLLATVGEQYATVYSTPSIALVVTGDELVPPGSELQPGQIFDSNSYALKAALKCFGIIDCKVFYAKDTLEATIEAFSKALEYADVVISSGGVSVGDHDYVKKALEHLSVETVFWKIAIKPGKPVYFGKAPQNTEPQGIERPKLVFGLPGNPVSVLLTYHQLVKPALRKMMGMTDLKINHYIARMENSVSKKAGRLDFMRSQLQSAPDGSLVVTALKGQDSHMLTGLSAADSLLHFPAEAEQLSAGDNVTVEFLRWFD